MSPTAPGDTELQRDVAIKEYLPASFSLRRPGGTAYMVMEYVQGETLEARLRRVGTLDESAIEALLAPLLDGLEQVHNAGFLHRDIKPANILIDVNGRSAFIAGHSAEPSFWAWLDSEAIGVHQFLAIGVNMHEDQQTKLSASRRLVLRQYV